MTRLAEQGDFKFAMTETAMGAALSGWPMIVLETRVPARLMTPTAVQSHVLGPDAIEAGYVDRVVDAGTSVDAGLAIAGELAKLPAAAYAANKRAAARRGHRSSRGGPRLSDRRAGDAHDRRRRLG